MSSNKFASPKEQEVKEEGGREGGETTGTSFWELFHLALVISDGGGNNDNNNNKNDAKRKCKYNRK